MTGRRRRRSRATDPVGASSHYAVEFGPVRWIFIDNSCFSIINCDPLQSPPFPDSGVDGVFVGHIKGMWEYSASGIPTSPTAAPARST